MSTFSIWSASDARLAEMDRATARDAYALADALAADILDGEGKLPDGVPLVPYGNQIAMAYAWAVTRGWIEAD